LPVTFKERVPTVDYGYVELEADEFGVFVDASASLHDHVDAVAEERGIKLLQNGGVAASNPGLTGPAPDQQPAQVWQQPAAPQGQPPACVHGPMKWVPPGVSKKPPYNAYNGFWGCQGNPRCPRSN
jgi:hypothetical protein